MDDPQRLEPLAGLGDGIEVCVAVLGDAGNARVIVFTLVIGALIATVEASGGGRGFVDAVEKRGLFAGPRAARLLAYLIDSTSAPICILLPLKAWGAYVLGLLNEQGIESPVRLFVEAVPMNLYALAAALLAGVVAVTGWALGPMRRAERRAEATVGFAVIGALL